MQIRTSIGHDVDDGNGDALLQVRGNLGRERAAVRLAIFIGSTDQFNCRDQLPATVVLVDLHFEEVGIGERNFAANGRSRRRVSLGESRDATVGAVAAKADAFVFAGGHVDLDARPAMDFLFGFESFRQHESVESLSHDEGPTAVDRLPRFANRERRMKVIEKRHELCLNGEYSLDPDGVAGRGVGYVEFQRNDKIGREP